MISRAVALQLTTTPGITDKRFRAVPVLQVQYLIAGALITKKVYLDALGDHSIEDLSKRVTAALQQEAARLIADGTGAVCPSWTGAAFLRDFSIDWRVASEYALTRGNDAGILRVNHRDTPITGGERQ